ncbi:PEP-CTERM sorting domain-containing protein [bacterium]|nr:PEP-CTERM sorting domain-containing protein [bacterium]
MRRVCVYVVVLAIAIALLSSVSAGAYNWSVQYAIDTSQSVFGVSQSPYPRDNRGLAISPDGRYLYAGYNNSYNSTGEVRKIDLTVSDYIDATVARTTGVRGKSIAVDDAGRVYLAEGSTIQVYDADLTASMYSITTTKCEGLTVAREGGALVLYGTDRTNKTLTRWELTESGGSITGATASGLDGDGVVSITGASSLRGVEVDNSGNIWMADQDANKVFRVDSAGGSLASVDIATPMDLAFNGSSMLVTGYTSRAISVVGADMSISSVLSVPWESLELDPDGQSAGGALSGIVAVGDGFYVTNETGQTADEKSTYGRIDDNSGTIEGKFYTDTLYDDNDPILHASVPEPGSLIALITGLVGLVGIASRRKRA